MEKNMHKSHTKPKPKSRVWQIVTITLVVLLVISIFTGGFSVFGKAGKMTGQAAGEKAVKFINENLMQGQGTVVAKGVVESGDFYKVTLDVSGQVMDAYVSKDGKLLFPQAINLDEPVVAAQNTNQAAQQQAPTNVQKSDKPKVELFVMSHCPYGTQMEKGIIPVVKTLGNKIDFEVKFVNYAMHGEKEVKEQLNQYCIQKNYPQKYLEYLGCFLEAGDGITCMDKSGITDDSLKSCKDDAEKQFKVMELFNDPAKSQWKGSFPPFNVHDAENKKYSVQGSPTLVLNGVAVQTGRDAKNLLSAVCGAFSNQPSECNTDLSSNGNPAPGFGFATQGGSASAAGCGV